jgi:predicted HicB family RNase H-like nuclease
MLSPKNLLNRIKRKNEKQDETHPEKPHPFVLRIPHHKFKTLQSIAAESGGSINRLIEEIIDQFLEGLK